MSEKIHSEKLPLPGQVLYELEYDLELDLKKCQKEYNGKYATTIKQQFVKISSSNPSTTTTTTTTLSTTSSTSTTTSRSECEEEQQGTEISVLQFNMLADALCTAYTEADSAKEFIGVDKECLRWSYRGLKIVELLHDMNTDIICLEECDQSDFLAKYLSNTYECLHQPKDKAPARHILEQLQEERKDTLPPDFKLNNDGIFIAFKKDKFEKIGEEVRFRDGGNEQKVVALAVHLRHKVNQHMEFLVIGTHLKSEKSEEGEKIRQKQIEWLQEHLPKNLPVILACDLNANPVKNKNGYDPLCYSDVTQTFGFESVYVKGQGKEPEFTTYKKRQTAADKHTIDYIFVKNGNWKVTELLQIQDKLEDQKDASLIPNWNYPSDHFAIGCKLRYIESNPRTTDEVCMCSIM